MAKKNSNKTENSSKIGNNNSGNIFGHPWYIYLIIGIVIIFIGLAIAKIVHEIFNNPITNGLAQTLGTIVYDFQSLVNSCANQTDCTKTNLEEECKNHVDCLYDSSKKICSIVDPSKKAGQSNALTAGCFGFIGLAVLLLATLFLFVVRGIRNITGLSKPSDLLNKSSLVLELKVDDIAKQVQDKTKEDVKQVEDAYEKSTGTKMTDSAKEFTASSVSQRTLEKRVVNELNTPKHAAGREIEMQTFRDLSKKADDAREEAAEKEGLSAKERAEIEGHIDPILPKPL